MPQNTRAIQGLSRLAKRPTRQQGFTLVEIAIVLVIVGLLLGAVLKGQELIFNTKIKSTYNLSRETSAALYAYQDRYRILPGDDNQATSRFPSASPATQNGNGNGYIYSSSACTATVATAVAENCHAIHHMRLSGFISGAGPVALKTAFGTLAWPAYRGAFISGGGYATVLGYYRTGFTHKMASIIDTSFDDGDPSSGSFACNNMTAYDMSTPESNVPSNCAASM